jgi:hypothetical protein
MPQLARQPAERMPLLVAESNHKMAVSAHAYVMPRGLVQIAEFVFIGVPGDVRSIARFSPTGSSVKK